MNFFMKTVSALFLVVWGALVMFTTSFGGYWFGVFVFQNTGQGVFGVILGFFSGLLMTGVIMIAWTEITTAFNERFWGKKKSLLSSIQELIGVDTK